MLLDDDFSSIVAAVRLGRRIFDNIKKAIAFIFAVHVPIAGLSLLPVFFADWPLLLLPVHIVFLELIIDPSCSLIFEAEEAEADVMRAPAARPDERLFSLAAPSGWRCCRASACWRLRGGLPGRRAPATRPRPPAPLTFTTLVVAFLVIILANRSWMRSIVATLLTRNAALLWVLAGAALFLTLALATPVGREIFRFGVLSPVEVLISVAAGVLCLLWFELLKLSRAHRRRVASR